MEYHPGQLMLNVTNIATLADLQPFFNTLVSPSFTCATASTIRQYNRSGLSHASSVIGSNSIQSSATASSSALNSNFAHIEAVIERDFLEPLPS